MFLDYTFAPRYLNKPEIFKFLFGKCFLFEALSVIECNRSHFDLCSETGRLLTSTHLEHNFPQGGRGPALCTANREVLEYK